MPNNPNDPAFDTKTNNDKVASALLRDQSMAPTADPLAIESLDALAAAKSKENEEAAKKAAEQVLPKEDDNTPPAADDTAAAEAAKAAADKAAADKAARDEELKKADEFFKDAPALPANASPKSGEAFSAIKLKAAQEISKLQAELDTFRKENETLKSSPGGKLTAEQISAAEKELKELREWRAKLDVDFDPKFQTYEANVSKSNEFIYAQLRKSPAVTDETIEQIKKYGGPDKCNLSELFKAIADPTLQRIVEGQISDIAKTRYEREQAIADSKKNISGYLEERKKGIEAEATSHHRATAAELAQYTQSLDWLSEKKAEAKATADEIKAIEDHNKFVVETRAQMQQALNDDSPRMRATLITGVVQLFNLQREHAALKAAHDAASKELTEVKAKWEKVKASGRSRLPESSAPVGGTPAPVKKDSFNDRTSDALDSIAKQVMAERARAGAQA